MIIRAESYISPVIRVNGPNRMINLYPLEVPRITDPGTTSLVEDRDIVLERSVGTTYVSDMQLDAQFLRIIEHPEQIQYQSGNEEVATVDQNGFLTHVSDGVVPVTATYSGRSFTRNFLMATSSGATVDRFHSWVEGSFGRACYDAIQSRIEGKTADEGTLSIYSLQNHQTATYVRNPHCWAYGLDLTPISPWNSQSANKRAGTLVAPDIFWMAAHYMIKVGSKIRFVTMEGEVVERTVVATYADPDRNPNPFNPLPDWAIGKLDSDVPESIGFCKVLPKNWADYLTITNIGSQRRVPGLLLDQFERATIADMSTNGSGLGTAGFWTAMEPHRSTFNRPKILYDSGNPGLLTDGTDLILVTVWTYGGYGPSGSAATVYIDEVNAAMTALGSPYQLTEYDLSAFPTYD